MSELSCFFLKIPHFEHLFSWLFPQIDAALHHGGAGTTGASLRGKSPSVSVRVFMTVVDVTASWNTDAYQAVVWVNSASSRQLVRRLTYVLLAVTNISGHQEYTNLGYTPFSRKCDIF
jgi:hypothetical protein